MELLRSGHLATTPLPTDVSTLVDTYSTSLWPFCRKLAYSEADAEDLLQDTFLYVCKHPHKWLASQNPKSFLFGVAVNLFKSQKRRYARRERIAPTSALTDELNPPSDHNTEQSVIAGETQQLVQRTVQSLPDKYRVVVLLHYISEMGVAEIATTLGIPAGTVKSRLHKARQLIEHKLGEVGYEYP